MESPREWLFGNVVEPKAVGDNENIYLKLFPDVQDQLDEEV